MQSNNCAIITGGADGYGKALALALLNKGYKVIVGDINIQLGKKLELECKKTAKELLFFPCDVTKEDDLKNLFSQALHHFGGANVMVNNAGIGMKERFETKTYAIEPIVNVNLIAVLKGTSLAIQHFNEQKRMNPKETRDYCIINVGSISGYYSVPVFPIYSTTKAAVLHLTKNLKYLKSKGIRINCIAPTFSPTNMVKKGKNDPNFMNVVKKHGELVSIEKVVEAELELIENLSLAGEILMISADGRQFLSTPSLPTIPKL